MKRLIVILLLIALTGVAHRACAQRGDFSDWNVPPPVPPGTMGRSVGANKSIIIPLADVPAPSIPQSGPVRLGDLPPVQTTLPEIIVPGQPAFPEMPFQTPGIALPLAPDAIALSQQHPLDKPDQLIANLPDPQAPELPDFPKMPAGIGGKPTDGALRIPVTPELPEQPVADATDGTSFPFSGWVIPSVPGNPPFSVILPQSTGDIKPAPKTGPKAKKTHKASN